MTIVEAILLVWAVLTLPVCAAYTVAILAVWAWERRGSALEALGVALATMQWAVEEVKGGYPSTSTAPQIPIRSGKEPRK